MEFKEKVADKSPNRDFISKIKNDLIAIEELIKKTWHRKLKKFYDRVTGYVPEYSF